MTFLLILIQFAFSAYIVTYEISDNKKEIIQVNKTTNQVSQKQILQDFPFHLAEISGTSQTRLKEILYPTSEVPLEALQFFNKKSLWTIPDSEIRTLIHQGPTENRIDLTIVGDGYTLEEKERFFEDATRITNDLFGEKTFASYLGLFNVHAVFVASNDSGITDTKRKDTALGLYRFPKNSKRGIMIGNRGAAERALSQAPDTDYPILLANDDFYGGLGGRYAITTRSLTSGSMVLRHELGHNFGNVGEEYDGGGVYTGANHSRSTNVSWMHWLETDQVMVYETKFLSGDYVWQNLESNPYERSFQMPSGDYVFDARISSVGWANDSEVEVLINDKSYALKGVYTKDRSFFVFQNPPKLNAGSHKIRIQDNSKDGDNVLAFAQLLAQPENMNQTRHFVGAYANFNNHGNHVGYRPTYGTCLMRDMRSKDFCAIDQENMWHQFLKRIDIIDGFDVKKVSKSYEIEVFTPNIPLAISWYNGDSGDLLASGSNKLIIKDSVAPSHVRVEVKLNTPENRKDASYLLSNRTISL